MIIFHGNLYYLCPYEKPLLYPWIPWNKGKKIGSPSEYTKQKMSESHKGLKHSQETKNKIGIKSKGNKGRTGQPVPIEVRRKISKSKWKKSC